MRRREAIAGKVSVPGKEDELHAAPVTTWNLLFGQSAIDAVANKGEGPKRLHSLESLWQGT